MRNRIIIIVSILSVAVATQAQRNPRVPPEMDPNYKSEAEKVEEASRNLASLGIRRVEEKMPANIAAMYRKPSKSDVEILKPSKTLADEYAEFLRQPNSGLIKLNADGRCSRNTETISGDEYCSKFKIPGGGTAFSFRYKSYRIPRLADLILDKNILRSFAALQQGVMVNLGDVPLGSITIGSPGLKYLVDLKLVSDTSELARRSEKLGKGVSADGYTYGLGFYVKENTTFALRSVAYEGTSIKSINGFTYDEFNYDKRKDVLIVFRIVEKDADGNVTIAWRELARRDAPTLRVADKPAEQH